MKKIFVALIGVLLLGVSCVNSGTVQPKDSVAIGTILMLTGPGASWGNASKNGIELATEDINNRGGVLGKPFRAFHEDDAGDPKKSLSAFQKLTETDGVRFLVGTTWSTTGLPLIEGVKEKRVIMISPSLGKPEFNEASPYLFNTWPHDYILSEQLAEQVFADGHRRVALFGAQEVWVVDQTEAFKRRFEKLGGDVVYIFEPQVDEKQVGADVLKVYADKSIDAIVYTNTLYNLGILTAKKMGELGVQLPTYSLSLDNDIISRAQGAYDGMVFLTFLTPTQEFIKRYESRYTLAVDIGADSAYDAVMMLAEAMEKTGSTDTEKVAAYLNDLKEYRGVSGHLIADGKGGFTKEYAVMIIKNGKAVSFE